jgi:hypothetical protein
MHPIGGTLPAPESDRIAPCAGLARCFRHAAELTLPGLIGLASALLLLKDIAAAESDYKVVRPPTHVVGTAVPAPEGPVILTVSGKILPPDGRAEIAFDRAGLESLGVVSFTTATNWTDGATVFEGVLLKNVLEAVQIAPDSKELLLTALNDYQAVMPVEDALDWPVILAFKENGRELSVRDRGPLWVVYPCHVNDRFATRLYLSRWVWQLASISVR